MATKSRRPTFSTAATTRPTADDDVPAAAATSVPVDQVAANPLNPRDVDPDGDGVRDIRESIARLDRQIEPSTVVTRAAFLGIFPELEPEISPGAIYVQVSGGQRLEACRQLGRDLDITIADDLAATPARFTAATIEENLKRSDLDAIEEARAVQRMVDACGGNQSEAGRQLGYGPSWVTHRMNLRRLAPETQTLIRREKVPIREVRGSLYKLTPAEQLAFVERVVRIRAGLQADQDEPGDAAPRPARAKAPTARPTGAAKVLSELSKLGSSPQEISTSLRVDMSDAQRRTVGQELRAIADELLRD